LSSNKVKADKEIVNLVRNILILGNHIGSSKRITRVRLGTLVRTYKPGVSDRVIRAAVSEIGALSTSGGEGGYWIPGEGTAEDKITDDCIGELRSRMASESRRIKRIKQLRNKVLTRTLVPEGITQYTLFTEE
jgi:hypothetical protein